jgi:hypothetical protein
MARPHSHIRDGAALTEYFAWLENELINKKTVLDEVDGAEIDGIGIDDSTASLLGLIVDDGTVGPSGRDGIEGEIPMPSISATLVVNTSMARPTPREHSTSAFPQSSQ